MDNVITSWDIILSNYYESTVPSNELFFIAESEECPLTDTYISIVNYDSEYPLIIPRGVYMENEHGIWIDRPVAASQSIKKRYLMLIIMPLLSLYMVVKERIILQ